ncbi:MAG: hypothetical protein Q8S73_18440 [Deltaproteobacteria bacterium]|nr:hypothetical protein [Myxococcales bacterium]MDP3216092.1 hypothetical protein [Deltaproteobacteria bacterium]
MRTLRPLLAVAALSGLLGCRTNPCGDQHAALPEALSPAGTALPDANVCYVAGDHATLMYWGGREKLDAVATRALATLNAEGWSQRPPNPYTHSDPQAPVYVFRRGDDELSLRFSVTQTPRLGSKLLADSVSITARRYPGPRLRAHP